MEQLSRVTDAALVTDLPVVLDLLFVAIATGGREMASAALRQVSRVESSWVVFSEFCVGVGDWVDVGLWMRVRVELVWSVFGWELSLRWS